MTTPPKPADDAFIQHCNGLRPESCTDWAAKLLNTCEEFWTGLGGGTEASEAETEAFINMLLQERSFRLACQVIPDLNGGRVEDHTGRSRIEILERLQHMRDYDPFRASRPLRSAFADDQYAEERERFTDAEMYRAELLLYTTASLNSQEKEEVRRWLDARPYIADTPRTLASQTKSLREGKSALDNMPVRALAFDQRAES